MQADVEVTKLEGRVLGDLYVRHAPEALRLAFLLTGGRGLAEDLVQDAFVRVAGRMLHLRSPTAPRIPSNNRSEPGPIQYRRRAVERRYAQRQPSPDAVQAHDMSEKDRMRAALMALPIRQRTAVVLRYRGPVGSTDG